MCVYVCECVCVCARVCVSIDIWLYVNNSSKFLDGFWFYWMTNKIYFLIKNNKCIRWVWVGFY